MEWGTKKGGEETRTTWEVRRVFQVFFLKPANGERTLNNLLLSHLAPGCGINWSTAGQMQLLSHCEAGREGQGHNLHRSHIQC